MILLIETKNVNYKRKYILVLIMQHKLNSLMIIDNIGILKT